MAAEDEGSGASDMADFLDDVGGSSDDGELPLPAALQPEPEPEPDPEPELRAAAGTAAAGPDPEQQRAEAQQEAGTPHAVADELLGALARRSGEASWLAACEQLATLGAGDPSVVEFKRRGGMKLLTALLDNAAAGEVDNERLLKAATVAIASCSGATARPQRRTFELGEGFSVTVQELPYETAGTGHAVWSAAVLQAHWLRLHRAELAAAGLHSALELGSGLGLSGLALAKLGLPGLDQVTLTDIVPSIVANLLASAALNRTAEGAPLAVRACLCDWGAENDLVDAQSAHGWYGSGGGPTSQEHKSLGPEAVALPVGELFDLVMAADVLCLLHNMHLHKTPQFTHKHGSNVHPCCLEQVRARPPEPDRRRDPKPPTSRRSFPCAISRPLPLYFGRVWDSVLGSVLMAGTGGLPDPAGGAAGGVCVTVTSPSFLTFPAENTIQMWSLPLNFSICPLKGQQMW